MSKPKTILVVDDDSPIRGIDALILQRAGFPRLDVIQTLAYEPGTGSAGLTLKGFGATPEQSQTNQSHAQQRPYSKP